MGRIKRILIDQLEIGMYVAELNKERLAAYNLDKYGPVLGQDILDQIFALGISHIYIDIDKGINSVYGVPVDLLDETSQEKNNNPVEFDRELRQAKLLQEGATILVDQVMKDIKLGNTMNVAGLEDLADGLLTSITNNQNALACITRLREKDRYLLEHSFSVGVLMGILARSMGFSGDVLHQMVTGALLHDIGKIMVPDAVLHKSGKLEAEEWEEMKRHVPYGRQVLDTTPGIAFVAKEICSQHHERLDGSGYPQGLPAGDISLHGRMTAIVDVYDAITADRVYHEGMTPNEAMKKLMELSGCHLDKDLVYQFIRCMSIYPVGSLVQLNSGKIALVLEANQLKQDKPRVKVIYSARERLYLPIECIDLARPWVTESIKTSVDPKHYGINLANFL